MTRQADPRGIRTQFAKELGAFLDEHDLSVVELGRYANVNHETISDAVENRRRIRSTTIEKLRYGMRTYAGRHSAKDRGPNAFVIQRGDETFKMFEAMREAGQVVLIDGQDVRIFTVTQIK